MQVLAAVMLQLKYPCPLFSTISNSVCFVMVVLVKDMLTQRHTAHYVCVCVRVCVCGGGGRVNFI